MKRTSSRRPSSWRRSRIARRCWIARFPITSRDRSEPRYRSGRTRFNSSSQLSTTTSFGGWHDEIQSPQPGVPLEGATDGDAWSTGDWHSSRGARDAGTWESRPLHAAVSRSSAVGGDSSGRCSPRVRSALVSICRRAIGLDSAWYALDLKHNTGCESRLPGR